jgi:predicted secreted Zn-dependent protease
VNLDVSKDMENYKETFVLNVQTLRSLLQRANCGSLRSKVNDLSAELSIQERQRREAGKVFQFKNLVL